ncbi:hypothetical protein HK101_005543, partial [Irineochytrium annulatum]
MDVARFTASYLRDLSRDSDAIAAVQADLAAGQAFESTERMAVMMLDISGYSKMSADLIIDVISLYNGDVVKFLGMRSKHVKQKISNITSPGDAVLVTFSKRHPLESQGQVVMRAIGSCLHIMSAYPVMDLNMKIAETNAIVNGSWNDSSTYRSGAENWVTQLRLHCAITTGDVSRVIVGDFNHRMDYFIYGDCL